MPPLAVTTTECDMHVIGGGLVVEGGGGGGVERGGGEGEAKGVLAIGGLGGGG